jgi:hypothetical protein
MVGKADFNTQYIRTLETELLGSSVADGDYIFDQQVIDQHGPRNNLVEYFCFVDAQGEPVAATGGTVTITFSPGKDLFQSVPEGTFSAISALTENRVKPNAYGKIQKVKVNLSGITGPVVGFQLLLTQSMG